MRQPSAWSALAVTLALAAAYVFAPESWHGELATLAIVAAASALVAPGRSSARASRATSRARVWLGRLASPFWIPVLVVLAAAGALYGPPERWPDLVRTADWGVNGAFIGAFAEANARGRPLSWATEISAGEPIADLYPTLLHRVLARFAGDDLYAIGVAMGVTVVLLMVAASLGAARTAERLGAAWPAATLAGLAVLLDEGSDYAWGQRAIFFWGFFPSAVAVAILLLALPGLLDAGRSKRPWLASLGLALAVVMHPVGLIVGVVLGIGTFLTWGASSRAHAPDRARALGWIALALIGSAWVWVPPSSRVVAYGLHYGTPEIPVELGLERMATGVLPDGSFAPLVTIGWLSALLAMRGRDPRRTVLAIACVILIGLYFETLFLDFGLAPTRTSVRWQSYRVGMLVKPLVVVLAAALLGRTGGLASALPRAWARRGVQALALVVLVGLLAREDVRTSVAGVVDVIAARAETLHLREDGDAVAIRDVADELAAEIGELEEGEHARVLMFCPTACRYALLLALRERGVSALVSHQAPAGFFLREQFYTASVENLRRFGIRYVVGTTREPPPAFGRTRRIGDFVVMESPSWDGELAHVVGEDEGEASVRTTVVPGEGFDIDVQSERPVRVEVGTPFYPRLRAEHESGAVAVESILVDGPGSELAVAMTLPPGRTRLRADGTMRSDVIGWVLTALTFGLALAWMLGRRFATERVALLRERAMALATSVTVRRLALAGFVLSPLVLVLGSGAWTGRVAGLRFGVLFPHPAIAVEGADGELVPCEMRQLGRQWVCAGGTVLTMTVTHRLQDRRNGWPVPAPSILIEEGHDVVVHAYFPLRLEGAYYGQCHGCRARVWSGESEATFVDRTTRETLERGEGTTVELRGGRGAWFALVGAELLD